MVIRQATTRDAGAIAEVQVASLLATYEGDPEVRALLPTDPACLTRHWALWLRRSRAVTRVAVDERKVVGFCALHQMVAGPIREVVGEIAAIFLTPRHWRRGIGRRLCEAALEDTRDLGVESLTLWVLESNDSARCFYDALDFRPDGCTRRFLERPHRVLDEVRYRRLVGGDSRDRVGRRG